jgi:hypothetical protein
MESVTMRVKPFIALIADSEGGTHEYLFQATTRRRVERDVREWVKRTDWGATIVAIEPAVGDRTAARSSPARLLVDAVAGTGRMVRRVRPKPSERAPRTTPR